MSRQVGFREILSIQSPSTYPVHHTTIKLRKSCHCYDAQIIVESLDGHYDAKENDIDSG